MASLTKVWELTRFDGYSVRSERSLYVEFVFADWRPNIPKKNTQNIESKRTHLSQKDLNILISTTNWNTKKYSLKIKKQDGEVVLQIKI